VLLCNPFVQILPLQIGKLGRKQPAIPFNVLPMAPLLGRFEVNHPPSPLWMSLGHFVDLGGELAAEFQIPRTNERSSPIWDHGLAPAFLQTTHLGNFMATTSF
jgi:hypothetical protein